MPDPKPTPDQLAAYAVGELCESECAAVEAYLEHCDHDPCADMPLSSSDGLLQRLRRLDDVPTGIEAGSGDTTHPADPSSLPPGFAPGRQVGDMVLSEVIGRGGMSVVFSARDTMIQRDVAVKVMWTPGLLSQTGERFLMETRAMGKLQHPHIAAVLSAGEHHGSRYLVMERATGTLRDQLAASGGMSWREATAAMVEIASGVEAAHHAQLIHRDIKPENVLVMPDGQRKVADFGLVRSASDTMSLTQPGQLPGTPHYMSPEQCFGTAATPQSDIYSLGATYFELLTGRRPYADCDSPMAVMSAHVHAPAPDLDAHSLPSAVIDVVRTAMAKRPEQRHRSCTELIVALRQLLASDGDNAAPSPTTRHVWLAAVVAALVIGMAAWGAVHYFDHHGSNAFEEMSSRELGVSTAFDVRQYAVRLLELGGTMEVRHGTDSATVQSITELPDDPFVITWIELSHLGAMDQFLEDVAKCEQLEGIGLQRTDVTDRRLAQLSGLPHLACVNISGTEISDDGIQWLGRAPRLDELKATGTKLSNESLRHLPPRMKYLTLNETSVDNAGLPLIAELPNLELLCLRGTSVTDDGLTHLLALKRLQSLNLRDTSISDRGLSQLHRMQQLRELVLSAPGTERSRVSAEGIERLQAAIPLLDIQLHAE